MSDYKKQITAIKVGIDKHLSKTVRLTSLAVLGEVIKNTPVDTGRARGNWWLGINEVPAEVHAAENKAEGAALQNAASQAATQKIGTYQPDQTIYISNNLPYIRKLNEGHSIQAPAAFVESAAQVGVRKAKEIAKSRFGE